MNGSVVARNYAEALLLAAAAQGTEDVERYGRLLDAVAGAVQAEERIAVALESPRVAKATKAELLARALEDVAPPQFVRFLQAVVRRGRQGLIGQMSQEYQGLVDVKLNRVHAGVTLVEEPDDRLEQQIVARLTEAIGKDVRAHFRAERSILGGVIVRVGDRIFDGSVRRKLATLRRRMLTGEERQKGGGCPGPPFRLQAVAQAERHRATPHGAELEPARQLALVEERARERDPAPDRASEPGGERPLERECSVAAHARARVFSLRCPDVNQGTGVETHGHARRRPAHENRGFGRYLEQIERILDDRTGAVVFGDHIRAGERRTDSHAHLPEAALQSQPEAGRMVRPHRDRVGGRVTRGSAVIRSRGLEGHTPLRHEARWEGDCEAEREQCAVAHQRISSLIQPLVTFFSPFTTQL